MNMNCQIPSSQSQSDASLAPNPPSIAGESIAPSNAIGSGGASQQLDIRMYGTQNFDTAVQAVQMIQEGRNQESRLLKPPSPMAKIFVKAIRKAILDLDSPKGIFEDLRITPCVHDADEFTQKAMNFMDMCSNPVEGGRPGHIKMEQGFRPKGNHMEGWIYVRWMEVGWRAAGFKAHRLGCLPLVQFAREDENIALRECLDEIMKEVYPVLVECFPRCHIVPVETCDQLWTIHGSKRKPSAEASRLRDALLRAQSSLQARDNGNESSGELSSSKKKTKPNLLMEASANTHTTRRSESDSEDSKTSCDLMGAVPVVALPCEVEAQVHTKGTVPDEIDLETCAIATPEPARSWSWRDITTFQLAVLLSFLLLVYILIAVCFSVVYRLAAA